jgi:hypothetical protein
VVGTGLSDIICENLIFLDERCFVDCGIAEVSNNIIYVWSDSTTYVATIPCKHIGSIRMESAYSAESAESTSDIPDEYFTYSILARMLINTTIAGAITNVFASSLLTDLNVKRFGIESMRKKICRTCGGDSVFVDSSGHDSYYKTGTYKCSKCLSGR